MDEIREPTDEQATPPPELRERVLSRCRREMAARQALRRQRGRQWRWSLAAGVAALLLLNVVVEQRSAVRIERLMTRGARVARAPQTAPPAPGALHARLTLLATLLRDPGAL